MSKTKMKEQDAKEFESILTPENKVIIEKVLNSIDPSSCYSGARAFDALNLLIGKRPTVFLTYLIDTSTTDFAEDLKGISRETRRYLNFLFSVYGYKLRGILSGNLLKSPDEWISIEDVSSRYDIRLKRPFMKIAIMKNNKECLTIEDTFDGLVLLSRFILEYIVKYSAEIVEFGVETNVQQGNVEELKKNVDELTRIVLGGRRKKKLSHT